MEALHDLLEDGLQFDPHYFPSMNSDHMPMTLCAMVGLGASADQLRAYQADYSKILRPVHPGPVLHDWRAGIGKLNAYRPLLQHFLERVHAEGIAAVVGDVVPEFLPGLAADAFHPLIRLGYAIQFESKPETAAAIAYMVSTAVSAPVDAGRTVDLSAALKLQSEAPRVIKGEQFGAGLRQILDSGEYPTGTANSFAECAAVSLDVYRSTRNFFALHMVTVTLAARICASILDGKAVLAALTGGLLAAHQIVGSPSFDRESPLPIPATLDREHAYKYVFACQAEAEACPDPRYRDEIVGFREKGLVADWAGAMRLR